MLIYNWFTRWLKNDAKPVREEPPVTPEPFPALRATESGSVIRSLKSETPFSLNKSRQVQRTPADLFGLLGLSYRRSDPSGKTIARVQSGKVVVEVLEVASDPSVWLPAWILSPENAAKDKPVLLVLDPVDSEHLWFQPDADSVLKPGNPVICSADIRGIGALQPEFGPGHPGYAAWHRQEENYAWGSLILGKTLVAQRVTDILALAAALRKHSGRPVRIAASGKLTVPALFAAALDPEIQSLYLSGGLASFRSIVDSETYEHTFADFVPGFLNHTDLPEIVASIAARKVVLAGPVGARGETLSADAARQIYADAIQKGSLVMEPDAQWSSSRLIAWANE
jgi:hypothetical protein